MESLAVTLSRQIVAACAQIGLTQEDILSGPIEFTDLPWQTPPLVIEAPLGGVPLSEYIDSAVYVNRENLVMMWSDALANMKNHPDKVLTFEGYRAISHVIPNVRKGERQLLFSMPDGFPGDLSDYTAIMLSLECAHLLRTNSKIAGFTSDDDNYYATISEGLDVGVKDGLPAIHGETWDIPVTGLVQEMLRTPRGEVFEGCDYNIIAKLRSVVHTYQKCFREYEALDWAIQTLRVVDQPAVLLKTVQSVRKVAHELKVRSTALDAAVELLKQLSMTDRQLIETLKYLLVPDVLTPGQFSKRIYSYHSVPPAVLSAAALEKLRSSVLTLYQEEGTTKLSSSKPQRSV